jgi:hypothetical protein
MDVTVSGKRIEVGLEKVRSQGKRVLMRAIQIAP